MESPIPQEPLNQSLELRFVKSVIRFSLASSELLTLRDGLRGSRGGLVSNNLLGTVTHKEIRGESIAPYFFVGNVAWFWKGKSEHEL